MKTLQTIIMITGIALGLGVGAASATNIECGKEWPGAKTKTCKDESGTKVTVDADANATAIATALANATATATGGNAASVSGATGGSVVYNEAKPNKVNYGVNLGINLDAAEIIDGPNKRANRTAMSYGALGYPETGKAVLDSTYWGKKANKLLAEQPAPVCFMDKDGAIHVNAYTDRKACLASHGF